MKDLLGALKYLLLDLAATLFFLVSYSITHNMMLAVIAGMVLAFGQIGWELARRKRVDALQWVGLVVIAASGAGTLHTHNPMYVMLQPTALYLLIGAAMLQRGWMMRYLPARAVTYLADLGIAFGYVWAGLMFVSALLNAGLALSLDMPHWGVAIAVWGTASKAALTLVQFAAMKTAGQRRRLARTTAAA